MSAGINPERAIGGHKAYGIYIIPGMGFRNNNATGIAINKAIPGRTAAPWALAPWKKIGARYLAA
jgi:hypothetical protein